MQEDGEASPAVATSGRKEVLGPMAGKGSQGPCCEADSPPRPLISGLGLI